MTTAPARQAPPSPAQLERATALAMKMLGGQRLGKQLPTVAAAIGKALVVTPPGGEHGHLLARVLRPAPGERPDDERAVLWLARRGETPTAAATAAARQGLANRQDRGQRLRAAAAPIVEADGARAAAYVATVVRETGEGPTWADLGQAMNWPRHPWNLRAAVIGQLARAGWLQTGKQLRSLRPGPMLRQLAGTETA